MTPWANCAFLQPPNPAFNAQCQTQGVVRPAPGIKATSQLRFPSTLPSLQPPGFAFPLNNTLGELRLAPAPTLRSPSGRQSLGVVGAAGAAKPHSGLRPFSPLSNFEEYTPGRIAPFTNPHFGVLRCASHRGRSASGARRSAFPPTSSATPRKCVCTSRKGSTLSGLWRSRSAGSSAGTGARLSGPAHRRATAASGDRGTHRRPI